jgi:BNR repeat-like domain
LNPRKLFQLLAGSVLVGAMAFTVGGPSHQALAQASDHFKAQGPDRYQGGDNGLFSPSDFEQAAASHPVTGSLGYFSVCRYAPFTSNTFYNAFPLSNVDAIIGDTTFALNGGTTCYNPQNEMNIVSNPTNANNLVTSSNDYRYGFQEYIYYSTDHGATWHDVLLPGWSNLTGANGVFKTAPAGGDPVLSFAPDGTLYFSALGYTFYANRTADVIGVSVSHDGGQTWSAPHLVARQGATNFFDDKEWVAAGSNGEVIVTWTRFNQGPHGAGYIASPIVYSISHDFGNNWTGPAQVSDTSHPYNQGSSPVIAPNGTIYVGYEGGTPSSGYAGDATIIAKSTNGGASWTNTEIGRVFDDYNCYPLNLSQGRQRLSYEQFRLNSFPTLALDPTTGKLAVVWADDRANSSCGWEKGGSFSGITHNEVIMSTSTNGSTWTTPTAITGNTDDVSFPSVSANAGRTVVGYYTRNYSPVTTDCTQALINGNDPTTIVYGTHPICLDYAARSSSDSFATESRLTSQSSNPYMNFAGSFIGDYTGVNVDSNGAASAAWTDNRGNPGLTTPNQDVVVDGSF